MMKIEIFEVKANVFIAFCYELYSPKARIGLASESFGRVAFDGKFLLRDKIP